MPGRWRLADEGAEREEWRRVQMEVWPRVRMGESGGKRKEILQSRWVPGNNSLTRMSFLLLFLPLLPTAHTGLWCSTCWLPHPKKNGAAFCLDSPKNCNGLTAAWSSSTSRLRVIRNTRRRKPANFIVLLEAFGKNAAGLQTAAIYAFPPTELKCKARGGTRNCGNLSPAQKLIILESTQ